MSDGPSNDGHSHMTILNGWKDIARYCGRGVRTVQRWERVGLPIHRPHKKLRSAVFAFAEQLNEWAAAVPMRQTDLIAELEAEVARLRHDNETLRAQLAETMREERLVREVRVAG